MQYIETVEALGEIYGEPGETSLIKETAGIIPHYRAFIEAAPFCALATGGPEGLDCSPRGDRPGFVHVADERTLLMPDRRGNNRIDSLKNIIRDPRIALMFMIPGHGNCLRVNGEARITADAETCARFAVEEKAPRTVIVIKTQAVYFQCARALVRSRLWDPATHVDPRELPTPGEVLAYLSQNRLDGERYDAEWDSRAKATLW